MIRYHSAYAKALDVSPDLASFLNLITLSIYVYAYVLLQLAHLYTKKRKEFGKHCKFSAVPAELLEVIPVTDAYQAHYVLRNPSIACFDTAPHM